MLGVRSAFARTVSAALVLAISTIGDGCNCARPSASTTSKGEARPATAFVPLETVYDGGLGKGWFDYGWAPRTLGPGPASFELHSYGGWIVAHPGLVGRYGALVFRMQAPEGYGDFLEVRLESNTKNVYPRSMVTAQERRALADGWIEVAIPMSVLNPESLPFDRIIFRAAKPLGTGFVRIDKIVLTRADGEPPAPSPVPTNEVTLTIDSRNPGRSINPLIYGIAYDPRLDSKDRHQWLVGASARRWGGNASSRFNWELGNAWNTANDWYFENVNFTGDPTYRWTRFLDDQLSHRMSTALTVPMIGWVAKDTTSYAFSIADQGKQRAFDSFRPDAGDGTTADGKPLTSPKPTRTSVVADAAFVGRWIKAIRERDQKSGTRSVQIYVLDNEPMLWHSTHRDVHPMPVGYDELLERSVAYAKEIRSADPDGKIAGPAEWGWPAYFFSAKDALIGFHHRPDRLAHGDVPLLAWYLREMRAAEKKSGQRLLDLVDVHFYPQADRVGGSNGGTDAETSAMRIRSTRALWDPTYVDESWIGQPVQLIPRLKQWIAENAPGLGIQIGEWNFGAEQHVSGGLAVAEALGRFAQHGVTSAFYWTYPPSGSPAFWAFRAFRDFDGAGGRFLDFSLPTVDEDGTSIFASRDASGTHLVAVVLNLRPDRSVRPRIVLSGSPKIASVRLFRYDGSVLGLTAGKAIVNESIVTSDALSPSSINVFDIQLAEKP